MSRRFPHRLRVTRPNPATPGSGDQDDDGVWVPTVDPNVPGEITLYNERADVQDDGATVTRDRTTGVPVEKADAKAFLRIPGAVAAIKRGDIAHVTWEDGTISDAEIVDVVRLDGKLRMNFL